MLDIRLLRENPDLVKARLANRGGDHSSLVDEVLAIDTARRTAETERQKLQGERNRLSKEIGMGRKNGQDTSALEGEVKGINARIEEIVAREQVLREEIAKIIAEIEVDA